MVRQKRDVAVIVIKCAIMGLGASAQQAAFGTEMAMPPKPVVGMVQDVDASASQAVGSYILVAQETKNADAPVGPQTAMQETKSADAPAEPQAVMREIKSATRLSSSKQRRRKPKMAAIPIGSRTVAQGTKEPESQAVAQGTKEPESQAVAQEAEEIDVLDKRLAVVPAKPQEGVKEQVAGAGKKRYTMAPIRWGVRLSETVGLERTSQTSHGIGATGLALVPTSSSSSGLVNIQTVDARGSTYILQPYIAQLGGNIGVVSSKYSLNNTSDRSKNLSNNLFGNGLLSLFSQSRFPFTMSLGAKDSRSNTEFATQDTVSTNLSLRQTYRPLGSPSTYSGEYQRDTRAIAPNSLEPNTANDTATHSFWQGSYTTLTQEHRINIRTLFNEKTTSLLNNTNKRMDDFTVTDTYLPVDSLLSLSSFANLNLFTDTKQRSSYLLVNTNAAWQPEEEDIPLFVDGSVHLFSQLNTKAGVVTKSQSLGGDAGARYLFSKNLTGRANGSVSTTNSGGQRDLVTSQAGNVSYRPDAIGFWKNSSYSWYANSGASNSTGRSADSGVAGGVGQVVNVPYPLDMFNKKLLIRSGINQSLAANISRLNGRTITLVNGGSVSLSNRLAAANRGKELLGGRGNLGSGVDTSLTLSVSDTRVSGGKYPRHDRNTKLTARLHEASTAAYQRSGLNVNVSLEAVQGTGGGRGGLALVGISAATYRKPRVFNVRGLDYVGSLSIQSSSRVSSEATAEDVNAHNPRFPWRLDQRLTYKIGQNEVLLRGLVSDQLGVKNASLWLLFRAWRNIGN